MLADGDVDHSVVHKVDAIFQAKIIFK
jgi:hypothetical protein